MIDASLSSRGVSWKHVSLMAWLTLAIGYISLIPVSNNYVLYSLLFSLGAIAGIAILRDGAQIDSLFLAPAVLWLIFVAYGTIVAIVRNADSLPRTLVFLLVWPVFYFVIVVGFKKNLVKIIFYVGATVTIAISVVFLVGGLVTLGHAPIDTVPSWLADPLGLRIVIASNGAIALTAHSLPPLMWWGAMWVASLACAKNNSYLPPVYIRFLAGSFAIAASIVAWRRGIVIVLILVPFIMLATWLLLKFRNLKGSDREHPKRKGYSLIGVRVLACYVAALALSVGVQSQVGSMIVGVTRSVATVIGINTTAVPTQMDLGTTGISKVDQLGDTIRQGERDSLTKWSSGPDAVFGHGIGASLPRGEIVRVVEPWKTELQYHALYYWTGAIGILLFLSTAVTALLAIRRAFRVPGRLRGPLYVSCVGAVATLVGNATNPYLQAPGHMWTVFFPFMIAGVILASQPRENYQGRQISIPGITGHSRLKAMSEAALGIRGLSAGVGASSKRPDQM